MYMHPHTCMPPLPQEIETTVWAGPEEQHPRVLFSHCCDKVTKKQGGRGRLVHRVYIHCSRMEREVLWFTVCTVHNCRMEKWPHCVQTQKAESDDRDLLSRGPSHVSAIDSVWVVLQMCHDILSTHDMTADRHSSLGIFVDKRAILWCAEKSGVLLHNCYLVIENIFLCMARHKVPSKYIEGLLKFHQCSELIWNTLEVSLRLSIVS